MQPDKWSNNNKWNTVNTSNTENTRGLDAVESKDRDKVLGKVDPKVIEKAQKDKEKAIKNGKIVTK